MTFHSGYVAPASNIAVSEVIGSFSTTGSWSFPDGVAKMDLRNEGNGGWAGCGVLRREPVYCWLNQDLKD